MLTTTFYKSVEETRFKLAKELIRQALANDHDVVVVDGSPNPEIREDFATLGPTQLVETPKLLVFAQMKRGMGGSRRELFAVARDGHDELMHDVGPFSPLSRKAPSIFVWTEPEKVDLIRLIPKIVAPIVAGEAEIVIPYRTPEGLRTYPVFQQVSEALADLAYMEITGLSGGPMFGPVAFSREVAPLFAECEPMIAGVEDTYIQHYAPMIAFARGRRVEAVEVDFNYPPEQRAEEEGTLSPEMLEKRMRQATTLIRAYFALGRHLGLITKR